MALHTALEPWSTSDQKLGALSYLESLATPEALSVLRQAMELTGLYVNPKDRDNPHLPGAGEVAGAAALALGRLEDLDGPDVLLRIILCSEDSEVLRECAAYGLGGLVSQKAFKAYEQALNVDNSVVLNMVLKSMEMSYRRMDQVSSSYSENLLVALFDKIVETYSLGIEDSVCERISLLLAHNLKRRQEVQLIELASSNIHSPTTHAAVSVLLERDSAIAREALGLVFEKYGGSPEMYNRISRKLAGSQEPRNILAADNALKNYPYWRKILCFFSKAERVSRRTQVKGAYLIKTLLT